MLRGGTKLGVGERSSVILLVLVAVLWVVVLAPTALRRIRERGGVGSVDHFHHQLELLEQAGPKLVAPAYRLRAGRSETNSPAVVSSRPKPVLRVPCPMGTRPISTMSTVRTTNESE